MNQKKTSLLVAALVVVLLIIDQVVKLVVKCNMELGESIPVFGDWFKIHFIENPGAAFGMSLKGVWGKLALTLFRIGASGLLIWYIHKLIKRNEAKGIIIGLTFVLAGALGNLIDSMFYGVIFDYAPLLQGKVVDMLYFPLFTIQDMPSWLSWMSDPDGSWTFFSPVFNIADSYITCAVVYLILFWHKRL